MDRLNVVESPQVLARGFANVNTPSDVESELLFSWVEKRDLLKLKIKNETEFIKHNGLNKQTKSSINRRAQHTKALDSLGRRINKRVNLDKLIIDRLRQQLTIEQFNIATALAKEDKDRILSKINL